MHRFFITVFIICITCLTGCKQQDNHVDNLFSDICKALNDSTISPESQLPLFNDYADALYNMIDKSKIDDISVRLEAQQRAADAMFIALDYFTDSKVSLGPLFNKLSDCCSVWKIQEHDDGNTYYKEMPFCVNKGTSEEHMSYMAISVENRDSATSQTLVFVPSSAEQLAVCFINKETDGSIDFDFSKGFYIEPDNYTDDDDASMRSFYFDGLEFYKGLCSYDMMFILYVNNDGNSESTMTLLDKFHSQIQ